MFWKICINNHLKNRKKKSKRVKEDVGRVKYRDVKNR